MLNVPFLGLWLELAEDPGQRLKDLEADFLVDVM